MSTTKKLFDALKIGCVFSPYPMSSRDRVIVHEYIKPYETIQEYLDRIGIVVPEYMRKGLRVNGLRVPYGMWDKTKVKHTAFISISSNVEGPIGIVFGIIAIVTVALSVFVAIINIPKPIISQKQDINNSPASPTYSISGGSNQSRPHEPMPLVFGKHRVFPDLAISPYTRVEGSDQILYQIFNFGINELTIEDLKIGETNLDEFNEVTTEVSNFADGKIELFPATTLSEEGSVLEPSDTEFVVRTSADNATALIVDLELQLSATDTTTGAFVPVGMLFEIQFRAVGIATWQAFSSGIELPNGVTSSGAGVVFTNTGNKAMRRSLHRSVEQGQYEVRVRRATNEGDDFANQNRAANWIQLLSMQPDEANYENRTRMGLRIRATAQLSGTVDALSAVVSNLIPVWDGATENIEQSSNPGHLYIWFLRGAFQSDGSKRFGAGLTDAEIDLDGLRDWADWCDLHSLSFNAIIDTPQSIYETLQQIATAGRASPQLSLTKLSVVYDEENRLPVQAFGMGSIIKDSFKVTYLSDNIPSEIIVKYLDEDRNYERQEVRQTVSNISPSSGPNPLDVELFGVTNLSQAGRQANLIAAGYVFRRRLIEFQIDLENLIATRGDVVLIGHDLTAWSESGRLVSGIASQVTLDKAVTVGDGSFITIRDPDLNLTTHTATAGGVNPTKIINISPSLSLSPNDNTNNKPKDYVWLFEDDSQPGILAKISDIKTHDNLFATLTCVEDNPEYYAAEQDGYTFVDPFAFNGEVASVKNIRFSETLLSLKGATELNISWSSTQAESVDITISVNDGDFETHAGVKTNSIDINVEEEDFIKVIIQVNAIIELRESNLTAEASYQVLGLSELPEDVQTFTIARNEDTISFKWSTVSDIDIKYYEIRRGGSWGASTLVARVNADTLTEVDYTAGTFLIKAVDLGLRQSETATSASIGVASDVNIVLKREQADEDWAGTLTNLVITQDNELTLASNPDGGAWEDVTSTWDSIVTPWIDAGKFLSAGSYTTESFDVGAANVEARVDVNLTTSLDIPNYTWLSLDEPWAAYGEITWAGESIPAEFIIFIATSDDDVIFTDFEIFVPGVYSSRFYKFRVDISKPEASVDIPTVSSMLISIDVKDIIILLTESIDPLGSTILFDEMNFAPNVQGTLVNDEDGETGDTFDITNITTSSFFVELFDADKVLKKGLINLNIHGF